MGGRGGEGGGRRRGRRGGEGGGGRRRGRKRERGGRKKCLVTYKHYVTWWPICNRW